jgi:hypothetical protein
MNCANLYEKISDAVGVVREMTAVFVATSLASPVLERQA